MVARRPIIVLEDGSKKEIRPPDTIDPAVLPPGSGGAPVAVKVDSLADLPAVLDPTSVYFVGDPKSIAQDVNGERCVSRLLNTSTTGIQVGDAARSVLADENGRVIWRF